MSDKGAIGVCRLFDNYATLALSSPRQLQAIFPVYLRVIRCIGVDPALDRLSLNAVRDDVEGYPNTPSISLPKGGTIRLRLAVDAGDRTITVWAKQPSATLPRPTARVFANGSIGLVADVTATAPTGAGWVKIGPLTFTASVDGGVFLELSAPWSGGESGCWFDTVQVK